MPISIPTITTGRLTLRAPKARDATTYAGFYEDAEASRFYGGPLGKTAAWNRLAADIGHWMMRGYGIWMIDAQGFDHAIGGCGICWPDGWPRPELTWWIIPAARRQGFAEEASRAVIGWAYENGWQRVETHMRDENLAARRLVEKLGGRKIARKTFPDGAARDIFEFPQTV